MMMCWWAMFFVAGVNWGGEPRILPVLESVVLLVYAGLLMRRPMIGTSEGWAGYKETLGRTVLVCITGLLITSSVIIADELAGIGSNNFKETNDDMWVSAPLTRADEKADSGKLSAWYRDIPSRLNTLISSRIDSPLLSKDSIGILKALILADRNNLDASIRDGFSYLGVAHYLALSGLHLGAIAGVLSWLMSRLPVKKIVRDFSMLICLTLYTMTAGTPHSLLRAMGLLITMRLMFLVGKKISLPTALIASSFFIVSFRYSLLSSPGFLLSFMAVAGIGYMAMPVLKILKPYLPEKGPGRILTWLAGVICITISVQLFTLPLILGIFGRVPVLAFIVNILLGVPVVTILYMGLTFVVIPAGWIQTIVSVPVNMVAWVFRNVPESASFLGGPAVYAGDIENIPYSISIIIACISLGIRNRWRSRLLMVSAAILILAVMPGGSESQAGLRKIWPDIKESDGKSPGGIEILDDGTVSLIIGEKLNRYYAGRLVMDLWKSGVSSLDLVIVRGTDMLSLTGIPWLGSRMKAAHLICSPFLVVNDDKFRSEVCSSFGRVTFLSSDTTVVMGGSTIFLEASPGKPSRGRRIGADKAGLRLKTILPADL